LPAQRRRCCETQATITGLDFTRRMPPRTIREHAASTTSGTNKWIDPAEAISARSDVIRT
jgi:hypothetical protein